MNAIEYNRLGELVYQIASTAESLDSDDATEQASNGNAIAVFSDLEYLKGFIDEALALALKLAREQHNYPA